MTVGARMARLAAVLAAVLALAAGAAQAQEITIALGSEPTTLDPQIRQDGGERAVNDNVYEALIFRTAKGDLVPGLAAGMPTLLNPTTWQFKLRPDVKFHNGEPLTADAVVASIARMLDPALRSENLSYFSTLVRGEKVDDLTVNIVTKTPDSVFLSRMYWLKIIPPQHATSPNFATQPVGTGPYRLVEWVRGERVVLAANAGYWGAKPGVQRVTYRFVSEIGTRLSGLLAREFDIISNLQPEYVKRAPKIGRVPALEVPVVIPNATSGVTADARVRLALNLAIDKKAIAEKLFGGFASVSDGQFISATWFGHDPSIHAYPYDPAKARALLKEAGAEGAAIELVGTAGRWLKDRETVEAIAAYWQAVGLKVDVKILEFDGYLKRLFDRQSRPQAVYVSHANPLLHADRTLSDYYHEKGRGSSNKDAELAALIERARSETDTARQAELYHTIMKRTHEQAYFVTLVGIDVLYGLSQRMDWTPGVDGKFLVKDMKVTR
jgi:peptide/nickel transport system substrate-binding protein